MHGQRTNQPSFCASCTRDFEPGAPRHLLDGAVICDRCNNEHPREGGYSFDDGARDHASSELIIATQTTRSHKTWRAG